MSPSKIAFALGGLAGNNAWGAGFLQAAIEYEIVPTLVSCTSGQIFWFWKYLQYLAGGEDIGTIFEREEEQAKPYKLRNLNWLNLIASGRENVFRPLRPYEYFTDIYSNIFQSLINLSKNWKKNDLRNLLWWEEISRWFPARVLVPEFPSNFFADISETFNQAEIGIVYNSYAPLEGQEYVHLNEKAREILEIEWDTENTYREGTIYQGITPENVKDALWIYQYGFPQGKMRLDGAYYRQIILSELVNADRIFVVRPINKKWLERLPSSYIELQDLQTEINFNGAYIGEKDKIKLINKLLREGKLSEAEYHEVELIELEIESQESFFDYIFEEPAVFGQSRQKAGGVFREMLTTLKSS